MYFFNFRSRSEVILDPEGQELPNLDAAHTEAIEGARDLAADSVQNGAPINLQDCFEITDEAGRVLETVRFNEAVSIIGAEASG